MIHPSYSELIQAINNNVEEDDNTMMLNSRYSLVLATITCTSAYCRRRAYGKRRGRKKTAFCCH